MTDELKPPVLQKPIPPQIINEGSALDPLDLKEYIQSPNAKSGSVLFFAELANEEPLPSGIVCTPEGLVQGTPAQGTAGEYELTVFGVNDSGLPFSTPLFLTIEKAMISAADNQQKSAPAPAPAEDFLSLDDFPSLGPASESQREAWDASAKLAELYGRPITIVDIYYLLQQYATLTIWDAYNLEPPGNKTPITLQNASPHYAIYDRGSCLIGVPKDLFSHERTLEDALQTSRAMADEVYKRGWVIQLAGFDKMMRAAWVELQYLGEKHSKNLEILYFTPTANDLKIYQAHASGLNRLIQK